MASGNKVFDRIKSRKPRYSAFDLSREQKLSMNMGELIPTYMDEIVPGDQFNVRSETQMRLAPMLAPVMHRINVYMHYFFVPNRIIWNQWEDFITGGQQGTSTPTLPATDVDLIMSNSDRRRLGDYLGLPNSGSGSSEFLVSDLPARAYQRIWSDYFRDPNFDSELNLNSISNNDLYKLRIRGWEKDYLTSSLPWAQRGDAVGVPGQFEYFDVSEVRTETGGTPASGQPVLSSASGGSMRDNADNFVRIENIENLDININDLRTSSALQRFLEKQARGGYRYIETILSHFGVRSSDARLQRAEYLGGGQQPIQVSEVLNTSGQVDASGEPIGPVQGDMAGHGISQGVTNTFNKRFEEHGYVIGILSVLPRTAYQQGVPRHFRHLEKEDYYWPEFANLGEQEVLNAEVYFDDDDDDYNESTFGYQQRYAEYKYGRDSVHGDFRGNLDFWHMGRIFDSAPTLGSQFTTADPTHRIFANTTEGDQKLWVQLYHQVKARRPMPYFSDPRLT